MYCEMPWFYIFEWFLSNGAVCFPYRKTRFSWEKSYSQAKIIGATISIMSGFFVVFYKGPLVKGSSSSSPYFHRLQALNNNPPLLFFASSTEHWALGGLFLALSFFSVSVWNIIQVLSIFSRKFQIHIRREEIICLTISYSFIFLIPVRNLEAISGSDGGDFFLQLNGDSPMCSGLIDSWKRY